MSPDGSTVYVASTRFLNGYNVAAWSVATGAVQWTGSCAAAKIYLPAAIALSPDGTELFETGATSFSQSGMTTVAYQA